MTDAADPSNRPRPPDVVAVRDHVRNELVRFVRALRRAGADIPANAGVTAARALVAVGFDDEDRVRAALRASLVTDRAELDAFDRLFGEFWRRLRAGLDGDPADRLDELEGGLAPLTDPGAVDADELGEASADDPSSNDSGDGGQLDAATDLGAVVSRDGEGDGTEETAGYSPTGSPDSVAAPAPVAAPGLDRAFRELTRALAGLRGRRWRADGDERADVRRALRESVATGGTVLSVPRRGRRRTAVRALLLVDVSRSVLDVVDRSFLLAFLRRARLEWRDARVFLFDEDLGEVSTAFDAPTAAAAEALEHAAEEWGGGTRIGGSLARLHETAPESVDRRTVVFVVSDGLEMGDVSDLERELSWLSRRAARVLWLNPLAASPAYEPTARGMAAALPYVDGLFAFTDAADVAEMAGQLRRHGADGRVGYEFDARTTRPALGATPGGTR